MCSRVSGRCAGTRTRSSSSTACRGSKLLKLAPQKFDFLTFEEYERLLDAVKDDPERRALVLVGGEAGLRQGEMIALEWGDVDLVAGTMVIRRSS